MVVLREDDGRGEYWMIVEEERDFVKE